MGNDESSKEKLIRKNDSISNNQSESLEVKIGKSNNSGNNNNNQKNNTKSNSNFPKTRNMHNYISNDNTNNNISNKNSNNKEDTPKTFSVKEDLVDTRIKGGTKNFDENFYLSITKEPSLKNSKNFISSTTSALIQQMSTGRPDMELKRSNFNGITIVQNLREYFPENISKEKVKEIIISAFGNNIVEKKEDFIRGKNVTKEQAVAIVEYVYRIIKNDRNVVGDENIQEMGLGDLRIKIDFVDLDKNIVREKLFQGQEPSEIQIENAMKNLGAGKSGVKVLAIFFE